MKNEIALLKIQNKEQINELSNLKENLDNKFLIYEAIENSNTKKRIELYNIKNNHKQTMEKLHTNLLFYENQNKQVSLKNDQLY